MGGTLLELVFTHMNTQAVAILLNQGGVGLKTLKLLVY